MEPLDLTLAPPRSARVMLDGLAMLARTIDKMRARLPGGNLGAYKIDGMSDRMMSMLGIDAEALQAEVARAASDADVAAWVRAHADPSAYDETTRVMLNRGTGDLDPDRLLIFAQKYPNHAEVASGKFCDIIDADDAAVFGTKRA